ATPAAAELVGELLQGAGFRLIEHAAAKLFAQLGQSFGRDRRLLARATVEQRHRFAVAAAGKAGIATGTVRAASGNAVIGAAVGTTLRATLLPGRTALLALFTLAALSLLTLLTTALLAGFAVLRIRR